jgi:hypothetical protein
LFSGIEAESVEEGGEHGGMISRALDRVWK